VRLQRQTPGGLSSLFSKCRRGKMSKEELEKAKQRKIPKF